MTRAIGLSFAYFGLFIWSAMVFLPLLFMFVSSFKTHGEILQFPIGLPSRLHIENYVNAMVNSTIGVSFVNSVIVTIGSLVFVVALSLMGGYALSRFQFPGNKVLLLGLVALLTLPVHALVVPVYYFMDMFNLRNDNFGLIMLYTAFHLPVSIIIMRAYFQSLPRAVEEAAQLDGCGTWGVFWYVAIPLSKASIATVAIINVVGIWSEYLFASVLMTSPASRTLPVAVATLGTGEGGTDLGLRFAGLSLATIPILILYLFFSRRIMKGIAAGAVK
ncbi:carbohydrate ABC transporter permease [Roseinatronobacter alkalisoli]|uniref:sn-glycerol-3-phosphate transport system permease protein UgpE n=1 Tax=Roseinatronobacter alkalisoli TaxID=3028235 RepID=A0ABT5TDN5_9RHOB|nr:carbohydrate ABC transporter permease [Roseinatronobacter sp. HJB301]MDD7972815.1 carbohydrate ABC transporter permease [Roseinatronobacter sp. HJB301]